MLNNTGLQQAGSSNNHTRDYSISTLIRISIHEGSNTKFNAMLGSSHTEKHLSTYESFRNTSASKEMQCGNSTEFLTETDEDATPLVVLSVIFQGHKIGGAFYDLDTCHLYLLPDHVETAPSYSVLRFFLKQAQPCAIVTSSRTDENVLNILRESNNVNNRLSESSSTNSFTSPILKNRLHLFPGIDFAFEACKHKLQNLELPNYPQNMNDAERKIYFSSLVDFTNLCMVPVIIF
ncbi:hypothetical protein TNCV_543171 [Trichonephila clavipes]|nr:hypothetical protein TNCV_543171 [Trichonephila clavipes]